MVKTLTWRTSRFEDAVDPSPNHLETLDDGHADDGILYDGHADEVDGVIMEEVDEVEMMKVMEVDMETADDEYLVCSS